jgi:hypothetical protein
MYVFKKIEFWNEFTRVESKRNVNAHKCAKGEACYVNANIPH